MCESINVVFIEMSGLHDVKCSHGKVLQKHFTNIRHEIFPRRKIFQNVDGIVNSMALGLVPLQISSRRYRIGFAWSLPSKIILYQRLTAGKEERGKKKLAYSHCR